MRVCCYVRPCQTATRYAGIGRYVADLLEALIADFPGTEWIILHDSRRPHGHLIDAFDAMDATVDCVGFEFEKASRAAECVALEVMLEAIAADWVLIPHLFDEFADRVIEAAEQTRTQKALIHYDLVPLVFAEQYLYGVGYRTFYMERLEWLNRFDLIASISEFSMQDLQRLRPGLSTRSVAIGTGSRPELFSPAPSARSDADQFVLCAPSGFDHRKNVTTLLHAYAALPNLLRDQYPLYLVGGIDQPKRTKLEALVSELGIRDQVKLLGFVDDAELIDLYRAARVFVFPSLYEGFGLPVLEAMLSGCVALAANRSALPEVIGAPDALFDPDDLDGLTALIERALIDDGFRESLLRAQSAHAQLFRWAQVAKNLMVALTATVSPTERLPVTLPSRVVTRELGPYQARIRSARDAQWLAVTVADLDRQLRPVLSRQLIDQATGWQIEGHFAGTYSLAQLNRESALGLLALGETVRIKGHNGHHAETIDLALGEGDAALAGIADADPLPYPVIQSRNLYPPKVSDFEPGVALLHHYAWEESGFPLAWAADFAQYLDGVSCLSNTVLKTLIDHGVDIPMRVSGCGVREPVLPTEHSTLRSDSDPFCFLHVSSCFPRKGVDVLLAAYARAFTARDAVVLKIKTFHNPHHDVTAQVSELKRHYPELPPIELIFDTMTDAEMTTLYQSADVLVAPSRAEGFGLPIAEAALCGVPVIVTGWGGPMDFCDAASAWLIDYTFARAASHLPVYDSVWAEPSIDHLQTLLRDVIAVPQAERQKQAERLAARVRAHCAWPDVMRRHRNLLAQVQRSKRVRPRVGWITTFGERCGIATTTEMLIAHMHAPAPVVFSRKDVGVPVQMDHRDIRSIAVFPSWDEFGFYGVLDAVETYRLDVVVIQFVYPFYHYESLTALIHRLCDRGISVVMELHESEPPRYSPERHLSYLFDALVRCDRILVHSVEALNDLKAIGLVDQVSLFPLGVRLPPVEPPVLPETDWVEEVERITASDTEVIASYGFFLPHKGLIELISVVHGLRQQGRDVHLLLLNAEYPSPISRQAIAEAKQRIRTLGMDTYVTLVTDFLDDDVSLNILGRCDVLVYPYRTTEQGASGAARFGLASGRPVVTTDLPIFAEFEDRVRRFGSETVEGMVRELGAYLDDVRLGTECVREQLHQANTWVGYHHYGVLARRYYGMLTALVRQKQKDSE